MTRRMCTFFGTVTLLITLMPGLGRAELDTYLATGVLQCQIQLPTFPTMASVTTTHKCGGAAQGTIVGVTSDANKENAYTADGIWTGTKKHVDGKPDPITGSCVDTKGGQGKDGCVVNFSAYNITYDESGLCPPGAVPPVGSAFGDAWILYHGNVNPAKKLALVIHFAYTRVGNAFSAVITKAVTITNPPITDPQTYKPVPNGPGSGVAAGKFLEKDPTTAGTCGNPKKTDILFTGSYTVHNP